MGGGGWSEYQKPDKEMEAAVASMIANGYEQKESESKPITTTNAARVVRTEGAADRVAANEQTQLKVKLSSMSAAQESTIDIIPRVAPAVGSFSLDLAKYMDESSLGAAAEDDRLPSMSAEEATRFDNELVMKCLTDKIQTESKFIISVFDFGGQSVFNVRMKAYYLYCAYHVSVPLGYPSLFSDSIWCLLCGVQYGVAHRQ